MDILAINEDEHAILLGECKWTNEPLGRTVVTGLIDKTAAVLPGEQARWRVTYAFFSRSGFTSEALGAGGGADCLYVELPQLDHDLRQ